MRASDKKLAGALSQAGLDDLAKRAADGEWNDFFGGHAMPQHNLVDTLNEAARGNKDKDQVKAIASLVERVKTGDFDATKEESEEWANSPEGQAISRELRETVA